MIIEESDLEFLPEELRKQLLNTKSNSGGLVDDYFIRPLNVFLDKYGEIPNVYKVHLSDSDNFSKHFEREYKNDIVIKKETRSIYDGKKWTQEMVFYWLRTGELIVITDYLEVYTKGDLTLVESIKSKLKRYIYKTKKENKIWLLLQTNQGLKTISFKLNKQDIDLDYNYNDDFKEVNNRILKKINEKDSKGIFLFHGVPGGGKTTYVKYLASKTKKKVIFLSPQVASNLHQPEFTEFLLSNSGCLLVIEDAELLIESRDKINSPVSAILNIADGLLSDELKIQIVCTFNTDLSNIDNAILRKGRLQAIYNFEKLNIEKTKKLINKIYPNENISYEEKEMTVAEIYNLKETNFLKEKKKNQTVGFK